MALSRWYNLFLESEFLCTCMMLLFPDPLVFAVGRKHVILTDGYLKPFDDGEKRMSCCLHTSSCFESVEQLTRGTAGICCGQNWTGVAWQLKGFASSVKETVPGSVLPGTPRVV